MISRAAAPRSSASSPSSASSSRVASEVDLASAAAALERCLLDAVKVEPTQVKQRSAPTSIFARCTRLCESALPQVALDPGLEFLL